MFNETTILLVFGIITVSFLLFLKHRQASHLKPRDLPLEDLLRQVTTSKTRKSGETAIYRHKSVGPNDELLTVPVKAPECKTLFDFFQHGRKVGKDYLGFRPFPDAPYVWWTYDEVAEKATNLGSALVSQCDIPSKKEANFGIYLKNCPEWLLFDLACIHYSIVSVPLYETFDSDAIKYIIGLTEMKALVTSVGGFERVLSVASECPKLKHMILVDVSTVPEEIKSKAQLAGIKVYSLKEFEAIGKAKPLPHVKPDPEDVCTICFTSGTTGVPKGVVLTHKNLVSVGAAWHVYCDSNPRANLINAPDDTHISYLPLAHMFERAVSHAVTLTGCRIGFYGGNILKLFDDIAVLQPTIFPSVPRLLTRLYDKIVTQVNSSGGFKKWLFWYAFEQKRKLLIEQGINSRDTIWDKIVFKKIQKKLGGKIKLMITGAAPIDHEIIDFYRVIFGSQMLSGFGTTECSAAGIVSLPGDYTSESHVGVPLPCTEMKLVDVPEMNYFATDEPNPRGEVWIRGNNVMKGYYKAPDKTAEALDKDGWLHTGDIGTILPNGTLKITDRKKNIFKLSQGEYVAPERVETKIKTQYVLQIFLHGDSLRSFLVGIVVPDPEVVVPWAKSHGLPTDDFAALCQNPAVNKFILDGLVAHGKSVGLHAFEIPRAILLVPEQFTVESGLLTPTFKIKRNEVKKKFEKDISDLYNSFKERS